MDVAGEFPESSRAARNRVGRGESAHVLEIQTRESPLAGSAPRPDHPSNVTGEREFYYHSGNWQQNTTSHRVDLKSLDPGILAANSDKEQSRENQESARIQLAEALPLPRVFLFPIPAEHADPVCSPA